MSEEYSMAAGGQSEWPAEEALEGNSLLTRPDENMQGALPQDYGSERQAEMNDMVPDRPEDYSLNFAKDIEVDRELLSGFQKAAHELGLSSSKAQKLADMYVSHQGKAGERIAQAQQRAIDDAKVKWESEIEARPHFNREREHARAALRQYGSKELYDLMDQTNIGSHPQMWVFLSKIGRELAEPGFHGKSGNRREPSLAARLWPNM